MLKRLINTPDGTSLLEIETAGRRRQQYLLPSGMSPAARIAFLASPRLGPILARLEQEDAQEAEGYVVFALHKLAMDLMARHPGDGAAVFPVPVLDPPPLPVARILIRQCSPSVFVLCTSYLEESVCREEHLDTLEDALVAALLALPPQAVAVEVSYQGIVSGTYPRPALECDPGRVASDALHTRGAIEEACRREPAMPAAHFGAMPAGPGPH